MIASSKTWDFILGSLRLILFLVVFTLTSISIFVAIFVNLTLYYGHSTLLEYIIFNGVIIIPMLVLLLGAHGFFYKNSTTLHWFSVVLLVTSVLALIAGISMFALSETMNQRAIEEQLKKAQAGYDWLQKPSDINSDAYVHTTLWDGFQSLFSCCGIEGPGDWVASAPKLNGSAEIFPRSCCSRPEIDLPNSTLKLCGKQFVHQDGCKLAIKFAWKTVSMGLVVIAALYSIVAGIARLIIRETEQEEAEMRAGTVADARGEAIDLSEYDSSYAR